MNGAFSRQVAGDHYVKMGMQPFQFAVMNNWDNGAFSILKYVSRHRSKNGAADLQKARHFVDMRQELIGFTVPPRHKVDMQHYLDVNGITGSDATALLALEGWVEGRTPETTVARLIDGLMREYASDQTEMVLR